jgi:hypothetical protein
MARPEYEITHAAIRYALQCMLESNWHALREMGFGRQECEALNQLTLADLASLEKRLSGHILKIELNPALFWAALADVRHEASAQQIRVELIKRDAPADMMRALYGIGDKAYTRLRRHHGAPAGVGRPVELDPDATWALSEILNRYKPVIQPSDWLAIANESGIGLRTIWREHKRWQSLPADCVPGAAERHREA